MLITLLKAAGEVCVTAADKLPKPVVESPVRRSLASTARRLSFCSSALRLYRHCAECARDGHMVKELCIAASIIVIDG